MKMVMVKDCQICMEHLGKSSYPKKWIELRRVLPDGAWQHSTRAGKMLHGIAVGKKIV